MSEAEPALDGTVFPDAGAPPATAADLKTDAARADYVARVCGAWDFGIYPAPETFTLFAGWREVFDRFPLADSPAYAAFRMINGWPEVPGGCVMLADYERMEPGRLDPCVKLW
jgi:hypothetical protein